MSAISPELYNFILISKNEIAREVLATHFSISPSLKERYTEFHINHYLNDTE